MFITLEGSEGSGKTTQAKMLAEFLRQLGYPVVLKREPGGTSIGEQIRKILSDLKNTDMQKRTEILLFQASRAQLVEQVIRPSLESGNLVICDRYGDSTLAYQGYGYGLFELDDLRPLINFATGGLVPDLTLLLDLDVTAGLQRKSQGTEWNRLDALEVAFYQRVRQGYLEMAQRQPERWQVIEADAAVARVQEDIRKIVLERLRSFQLGC